jgi:hypothetical protein
MTKEEFIAAIAGLPVPFWVVMRNGDQLQCDKVVAIGEDRFSIVCEELPRVVHLVDVQSVRLTLQVGTTKPPEPFAPLLGADF